MSARQPRGAGCALALLLPGALLSVAPVAAQSPPTYPSDAPLVWPATVSRTGGDKSGKAQGRPSRGPWKAASVDAVVPREVKAGELATVLPLQRSVPAQDFPLKVVHVQPGVDAFPPSWTVALDASVASFLKAKATAGWADHRPFDAVMVYPANKSARLLPLKAVADLPNAKGASAATLWAAVDLSSDGKADVVIFRFCCDRPEAASRATGPSPCGYNCEAIYLRSKDQPWRLVHQASDD